MDNSQALGEAEKLEKAYNAEIKEDSESDIESDEEADEENIKNRKEKVKCFISNSVSVFINIVSTSYSYNNYVYRKKE